MKLIAISNIKSKIQQRVVHVSILNLEGRDFQFSVSKFYNIYPNERLTVKRLLLMSIVGDALIVVGVDTSAPTNA